MKKIIKVLFMIFCVLAIGILAFLLSYKVSSVKEEPKEEEKVTQEVEEKKIVLKPGNYTVNEIREDEAGVSNAECGVKLKENGFFEIYMGWGAWHSGKYTLEDENLICESTAFEWESGEYGRKDTDVIFTFKVLDDNTLRLDSIDIRAEEKDDLIYEDGLEIGMTYSKK